MTWSLALLLSLFAFAYADVFAVLWHQWNTNDVYSHGIIIPLIAAYFIWHRRHDFGQRTPAPLAGMACLLVGIALLLAGRALGISGVTQVSMLPVLGGIVLAVMGWRALGILAFPLGYLLLAMPIWDIVTERLHHPFQLFSARLGAWIVQRVGVPVYQEATYLVLPSMTLEVARICSGVNYLIAVIAVGLPLAYFSFRDTTRRVILVAFGLSVAILANSLRVASIAWFVYHGYQGALHGPGHMFQGLFVATIGYVALFAGAAILTRWKREPRRMPRAAFMKASADAPSVAPSSIVVACAALALVGAGLARPLDAEAPPLNAAWSSRVPASIGAWHVVESAPPVWPLVASAIGTGDIVRTYERQGGPLVQLQISPYARRGAGISSYWTDRFEALAVERPLEVAGRTVDVNTLVYAGERERAAVAYWFELPAFGRTSERLRAKLAGAWSAVDRRTPVVAVVVTSAVGGVATTDDATREVDAFIRAWLDARGRE